MKMSRIKHPPKTQRRPSLWRLARVVGLLAVLLGGLPALRAAGRPNILLILADDLGYSDLGCYGGEIATPHLDRLASGGMRFTSFYNSAKCEPTRASLMSGQYWQDTGLGVKRGPTLGEAMRLAGYATFAVGKWHLDGNPVDRGFDHFFGHLSGASDYFKGNASHRLDDKPFKPPADGTFYTTDANADYAIQFLGNWQKTQTNKPFFTYLAFNAPHSPLQAPAAEIAKYRGKYLAGWDMLREQRYKSQVKQGITRPEWAVSPRPETIPAWDTLSPEEKEFEDLRMATYAAMVNRMDQAIGRVLAKIKDMGETKNTLVIFLSDNGANPFDHGNNRTLESLEKGNGNLGYGLGWASLSETPFRHYKRNMFNGGSCTPCIAYWPEGIKKPGTITDQRAHIIDLMATFLDVGKGSLPAELGGNPIPPLPGKSLRPILAGEQRTAHPALYFQLFDHRAVIEGDLKLVSDWGRPWELFDLATDRTELHDLAATKAADAARLEKMWNDWAAGTKTRVHPAGPEPTYRHLGAPPSTGLDEEEGPESRPKRKSRRQKSATE